jgi:cyclopropane-fatty-acyl-phospholipid synthase
MGIRRLIAQRLAYETAQYDREAYVADLKTRDLAEQTAAANEQHYEIPTPFYHYCLGKNLKYSSSFYENGTETLDEAESAMLAIYSERA